MTACLTALAKTLQLVAYNGTSQAIISTTSFENADCSSANTNFKPFASNQSLPINSGPCMTETYGDSMRKYFFPGSTPPSLATSAGVVTVTHSSSCSGPISEYYFTATGCYRGTNGSQLLSCTESSGGDVSLTQTQFLSNDVTCSGTPAYTMETILNQQCQVDPNNIQHTTYACIAAPSPQGTHLYKRLCHRSVAVSLKTHTRTYFHAKLPPLS